MSLPYLSCLPPHPTPPAHIHIPPQWVTADGWNMDQLLADAANELDQPACSWGTGHNAPEACPYQNPVPGISGITSLYSQLRERNRCNHNDFQNIGVNGADIGSSYDQVTAMKRSGPDDHPALVWLAMIGNDVCNGHPGYDERYACCAVTRDVLTHDHYLLYAA
jgi:acyloxyacyl hydrolase